MIISRKVSNNNSFKISIEDVDIWIKPKLIYLYNDENLKTLFRKNLKSNSLLLSQKIKEQYQIYYHKPLLISSVSLSAEIIGHYFVDNLSVQLAKKIPIWPFKSIFLFIHSRTHRFDCGEKRIDTNRWIWDIVGAILYRK